jgi:hypothetical protein
VVESQESDNESLNYKISREFLDQLSNYSVKKASIP